MRLKHLKHALETLETLRRKIIMACFQIEVEGKADMWGLHIREWREREAVGVFWDILEYTDI
jgi:hypothetical protein